MSQNQLILVFRLPALLGCPEGGASVALLQGIIRNLEGSRFEAGLGSPASRAIALLLWSLVP